MTNISGEVNVE